MKILTATTALIGWFIGIHLILFTKGTRAILLGAYTALISIACAEPLIRYLPYTLMPLATTTVAVCSYLIGPVLFLYCKYVLTPVPWRKGHLIHFIPATFILLLYILSYLAPGIEHTNSGKEEFVLYMIFQIQLLGYTITSLVMTARRGGTDGRPSEKLQRILLKPLVITSLALFLYSLAHSLLPVISAKTFVWIIQTMLAVLIMVIALLHAENLEKHKPRIQTKASG